MLDSVPDTGMLQAQSLLLRTQSYGESDPIVRACVVVHSCLTLCNPMDCSQPGSSVHGILWVRLLEWVAGGSSHPRDGIRVLNVSCIGRRVFYH